ncbi:MAG: hypothetical protein AAF721_34835, partial [Myxococcota bacterium]
MLSLRIGLSSLTSLLAAGTLFMLAAPGCAKYPNCKKDKDCRAENGEKCVANTCQNCKEDTECVEKTPEGQPTFTCNGGRGGPPPA